MFSVYTVQSNVNLVNCHHIDYNTMYSILITSLTRIIFTIVVRPGVDVALIQM